MSSTSVVPISILRSTTLSSASSGAGSDSTAWAQALPPAAAHRSADALPLDQLGRPLHDLRISVTDRCNFRCGYCMPRSVFGRDHAFLPQSALLSFEEITRAARLFLSLGVRKLRLTGGEPLLRKDLHKLVAQLTDLRTLDGEAPEITLTTNGALLARKAQALKDAGLRRVTVSLDALDDAVFKRVSDTDLPVREVLEGIDAAQRAGLEPIKVNMVVQKGANDDQIVPLAGHFRGTGVELRFIEFMDVGSTNGWNRDKVLPSDQVRARIHQHFALTPAPRANAGETAERWAYADGQGQIGFISSVTRAFCGDCNRLRLSTDGRLYTCLFAHRGHDLRSLLRGQDADELIAPRLAALWQHRRDQYSQLRAVQAATGSEPVVPAVQKVEMSYIGG